MTKYATVVFFILTLSLSMLNAQQRRAKDSTLQRALQSSKDAAPAKAPPPQSALAVNTNLLTTPAQTNQITTNSPGPGEKGK